MAFNAGCWCEFVSTYASFQSKYKSLQLDNYMPEKFSAALLSSLKCTGHSTNYHLCKLQLWNDAKARVTFAE